MHNMSLIRDRGILKRVGMGYETGREGWRLTYDVIFIDWRCNIFYSPSLSLHSLPSTTPPRPSNFLSLSKDRIKGVVVQEKRKGGELQ